MIVSADLFAGGGGASLGIAMATGRAPVVAINHDEHAIAMHKRNHPKTWHHCQSVFKVTPERVLRGLDLDLLWASPDCTHFSRAKGAKPRSQKIRSLAWVVHEWALRTRPRVICVENVPEFEKWGPLDARNRPIKSKQGETFREWVGGLLIAGYKVEWRVLTAADYGAPTTRKRLFIIARCDGEPIRWPVKTHGPGRGRPWRTAAECIDWSIPCPSIFERKRPLAEATQRRIAAGLRRYVLEAAVPYIVRIGHQSNDSGKVHPASEPLRTITSKNEHLVVAPTLIQTGYGERTGQRPRTLDLQAPLGTVVAGGSKHALVAAWLAKHYTGVVGHGMRRPIGAITAKDHHSLAVVELGGSNHREDVAAFITKYYGAGGTSQGVAEPLHTIVSKARFGLVTVRIGGADYVVSDIGMRMLGPRELARAQSLPDDYVLIGTKAQQIARIGNSVPPVVVRAIVEAQFGLGNTGCEVA